MEVSTSPCLSWRWGCIFLLIPAHALLKVALEERTALCTSRVLNASQGTLRSCREGSQAKRCGLCLWKANGLCGNGEYQGDGGDGVQTSFYRWELEVAKAVHLSLSHAWSGCLAPSVMAVLSLWSAWPFFVPCFVICHQFSCSVVSTLCDPMDYSTPGLPDHHQLPESIQTHVHWVSDAIQPSHPLSPLSPPSFTFPTSGCFQMT